MESGEIRAALMVAPWRWMLLVSAVTAAYSLACVCGCIPGGKTGGVSGQGKASADAVHVPLGSPDQSAGSVGRDMKGNETTIPVGSPSAGRDVGGDAAVIKAPIGGSEESAGNTTSQTGFINLSLSNAAAARGGVTAIVAVVALLAIWKWLYWKRVAQGMIEQVEISLAGDPADTGGLKAALARRHASTTAVGKLVERVTRAKRPLGRLAPRIPST